MSSNSSAVSMTSGPIWKRIIFFAIPLFFGNLFQQLYNTADSLIVGRFLGSTALAAVSSSGNLIFLMVGFFNGLAIGAGVVVAKYYGAKRYHIVQRTIHTIMALGLICGVVLTFIGVLAAPQILVLMGTPSEVLPNSITYFRIYFCGSLAFVMYNFMVGILQSVGDSRHPLIYLVISSIVNIVLDLLFVGVFHWGVGSAALATIISQFISAFLCLGQLMKSPEEYRVHISKIRIDFLVLRQIISNGLPSGLQNSIISLANVVVQSNINKFGEMAVAGCGSYSKVEGFGFLPITCFALALTTFIGQNLGARRYDRVRKGIRIGLLLNVIMAETIALVIFILSPHLIALFDRNPEVIAFGVLHERTTTPFFFLLAYTHAMAAIFRGAGKATVSLAVMAVCWCVIRMPYVTVATHFFPVLQAVSWGYPITWCLSAIVFTVYYLRSDWLGKIERQAPAA